MQNVRKNLEADQTPPSTKSLIRWWIFQLYLVDDCKMPNLQGYESLLIVCGIHIFTGKSINFFGENVVFLSFVSRLQSIAYK